MHLCISIGRIIGSMARSCYPVFGDYYRSFVFGTRSVLCLWLSYLVLIAGVVVLFNPFTAATVPFIILGVSSIVYGLSDLVNIIRFRQKKDIQTPIIEDVTPIEEIKD